MPFPLPYGLSLINPILTPPDRRDLLNITGDNTVQSSRFIDPTTADFAISSDNQFQGMNFVEQEVQIALNTTFNSSVVLGFGQNFLGSPVITPYVNKQMANYLNQALQYLISNNLVVINGPVAVVANQFGQVSIQFTYTNTSLGTTQQVSYNIQQV